MFAELRSLPMEVVRSIHLKVDGMVRRAERAPDYALPWTERSPPVQDEQIEQPWGPLYG